MMRYALGPCVWLVCASPILAGEQVLDQHVFTLPDGFVIERIAAPPLVERPITIDFDELGRMYVADSSGSNDKVELQLAERPHRILRLEDSDGDGLYDRRTVFADKMMFPEGTLWYGGSLYVAAPPSIWKLTDTNGDGVADLREEWFQGKTLTGCANDLHGPYLGPDGWIYWCKGAFAEQTYERPGRSPLVTRAAHIFRCRPDGSGVEAVMTGGMDNPVDVVFTAGGERIFSTTFLQHPGGGLRDGLIHAVYGGVYGKDWSVIENHQRTGDVMPVLAHLGAAAPCGLAIYESAVFGSAYQGNLFACLFNMHKVTRHVLTPRGASFKSHDEDFVVSSNLDFHPTDVQEDADGSLVIVDTGGWYKLCCPTSQLWKPDVLGAIYRVRKREGEGPRDPRGLKIAWDRLDPNALAELLADSRPAVRRRAQSALAALSESSVGALTALRSGTAPEQARLAAVWTLARIDHPLARAAVRAALADGSALVRQAAAHAAGVARDPEALTGLVQLLRGQDPHNRRAAAEALGRLNDGRAVAPLLAAAGQPGDDRALEHSITYALIELAAPLLVRPALDDPHPRVRRAALLALDQMEGGGLDPLHVAGLLQSPEPLERDAARWIMGRRPEWAEPLAGFLQRRLEAGPQEDGPEAELEELLARFARSPAVQHLLARAAGAVETREPRRAMLLRAMSRSGLKELPDPWAGVCTSALHDDATQVVSAAIGLLRRVAANKEQAAAVAAGLARVAARGEAGTELRLAALAAMPAGHHELAEADFDLVVRNVPAEVDAGLRALAVEALSRARLGQRQLMILARTLPQAGPIEADRLLSLFKDCADEQVGLELASRLRDAPVLDSLRVDTVKSSFAKFPATVAPLAQELLARLQVDAAAQQEKLESVLSAIGKLEGDVRRGQLVFNGSKAACSTCHAIGYLGGKVGPDLTRIGQIRNQRDLLESILFPNASFVRSYEPVVVLTISGQTYNGIVTAETPEEILLTVNAKDEVRIDRKQIEELRPGNVSVMPSGLDQQLTLQDLADLITFLKAAR